MKIFPRSSRLSATVSLLLACPGCACAQQVPDTAPRALTLDTIVVSAMPVSPLTYAADAKLPRQPVPASDGADYLKTIPGFSALRNGGSNGDPVLRGMFGSRLNLLSNDGSMPGACPARMGNPMSYVSPETYDRLVVVKGPQTVLWGPGASAGTVRFERSTAPFEQAGLRVSGSLLTGSAGRSDQVFDATAGAPKGYIRASGNRSRADDYRDGNGEVVPSSWKKWNADLAFGWTPDADTVLEATIGRGDGQARYAGRGMDGAQFKRESLGLRLDKSGFDGALDKLRINLFRNDADHVMDNYSLREPKPMSAMPVPMASNLERRTVGGRAALAWQWEAFELEAGADAQRSRHRSRSAMGRHAYSAVAWTDDAEFRNLGLFAEAAWAPAAQDRWVFGLRGDRAEVTDQRRTAGMVAMRNPTAGMTRSETLSSGFVRFEQQISGMPLLWYAGLGHAQRMPDYWELISPNRGPAGAVNAFAGMQPEKTTQLDVGLQYHTKKLDAWVSAYAGRLDDYILFTYTSGGMMGPSSSVANVDARIHGGEGGVEWRPREHWKLGGTVAQAWGSNDDRGTALPQMPPVDLRLNTAYEGARWSFGALLRAVRGQQRIAIRQGNVSGRDIGPSTGFATLALNGGYRFSPRLRLTAGIDNVFDRAHSEHLNLAGSADFGYPAEPVRINEPGRTSWLKLNVEY